MGAETAAIADLVANGAVGGGEEEGPGERERRREEKGVERERGED